MSQRKINILHFGCPYLPYQGGSTSRLHSLVQGYNNPSDFNLYLITPIKKSKDSDDEPFKSVLRKESVNKIVYDRDIKEFIEKKTIDVVVIHNSRALLKWLVFYKVLFPKIKLICEIHSFRDEGVIKSKINKFSYKFCDEIVVLSKSSKNLLVDKYNIRNSHVIYNGFKNITTIQSKANYNPESGVVFSYVGSFHSWQGITTICDAIEELYHEGFWFRNKINIVGGGILFDEVRVRISKLDCDNINLSGWISKDSVGDVMSESHFLLAPRESTLATESVVPLKVAESIQYSIPMICSPVGGLLELLPRGDNVALYMNTCEKDALIYIMKLLPSSSEYQKMRENLGRQRSKIPTWDESSSLYSELFKRVVS